MESCPNGKFGITKICVIYIYIYIYILYIIYYIYIKDIGYSLYLCSLTYLAKLFAILSLDCWLAESSDLAHTRRSFDRSIISS